MGWYLSHHGLHGFVITRFSFGGEICELRDIKTPHTNKYHFNNLVESWWCCLSYCGLRLTLPEFVQTIQNKWWVNSPQKAFAVFLRESSEEPNVRGTAPSPPWQHHFIQSNREALQASTRLEMTLIQQSQECPCRLEFTGFLMFLCPWFKWIECYKSQESWQTMARNITSC